MHQFQLQIQAGQWAAAARTYTLLAQSQPAPVPLHLPAAHALFRLGQAREALDALLRALAPEALAQGSTRPAPPGTVPLLHAACLAQLGRHAEARQQIAPLLSTARSAPPGNSAPQMPPLVADAWFLLASCLAAENRPWDAARALAAQLPSLPSPHQSKALVACLQFLLKALQNSPNAPLKNTPPSTTAPELVALRLLHPRPAPPRTTARLENNGFPAQLPPDLWVNQPVSRQLLALQFAAQLMEHGVPENARTALLFLLPLPDPDRLQEPDPRDPTGGHLGHQRLHTAIVPEPDPAKDGTAVQERALQEKHPELWTRIRLQVAAALKILNRNQEAALVLEQLGNQWSEPGPAQNTPSMGETVRLNALHAWGEASRPDRVRKAAAVFLEKHPHSSHLPEVLYLKASADREEKRFGDAIASFGALAAQFPKSAQTPAARFQSAYCQFLAGNTTAARAGFSRLTADLGTHLLAEESAAWEVYTRIHDPKDCHTAANRYLKRYGSGAHSGSVRFQKARAAHLLDDPGALQELESFLRDYPEHPQKEEALLVSAESQAASGDGPTALQLLGQIPLSESPVSQEAWFRRGQMLRMAGRYSDLLAHMEHFAKSQPKSPRLGEAVLQSAWCHRKLGHPDTAEALSWETVRLHGNDPANPGIDDILVALCENRHTRQEPGAADRVVSRLAELRKEAQTTGQQTLALRCIWAESKLRPEPGSRILPEAARQVRPETAPPAVLADLAEALPADANPAALWLELLRWNPEAPQKDRALLALAHLNQSDPRKALEFLNRLETETPATPLLPRALLLRAHLLGPERPGEALEILGRLLTLPSAGTREKALALLESAGVHIRQGRPALAIPFYQKVYVTYLRWPDLTTRAYMESARAFDSLGDRAAARRTCEELLRQPSIPPADRAAANQFLE
ncbi:MAG: hypothetical protein RLZZ253_3171, partial [Verrucomicrobiota bacterium]